MVDIQDHSRTIIWPAIDIVYTMLVINDQTFITRPYYSKQSRSSSQAMPQAALI